MSGVRILDHESPNRVQKTLSKAHIIPSTPSPPPRTPRRPKHRSPDSIRRVSEAITESYRQSADGVLMTIAASEEQLRTSFSKP